MAYRVAGQDETESGGMVRPGQWVSLWSEMVAERDRMERDWHRWGGAGWDVVGWVRGE